jgi:hypothetical protein
LQELVRRKPRAKKAVELSVFFAWALLDTDLHSIYIVVSGTRMNIHESFM